MRLWYLLPLLLISACQNGNQTDTEHRIEIFTWWTSGSEAAALQSVIDAYQAQYPDVEVINASIAGGGGSAARPVLQTRLVGGNPPDTWQTHHGAELMGQYIAPGFVASLKNLYESEGWYEVFSPSLINMVSKEDEPYLIVLNLHRSNTLWYNKPVLSEHGIVMGESLSMKTLFEITEQLESVGVTPMCMGDTGIWATGIMFDGSITNRVDRDSDDHRRRG